jgi:putative phosphoesterase
MRIAILSDIHSNLHALEAVLADVARLKPDQILCLGDLVDYGAYPNEVIELIRERNIPTVMGNCDEGVGFDLNERSLAHRTAEDARVSRASLRWTRERTTPAHKEFLRGLPLQLRQNLAGVHVMSVHGSPRKIDEYVYQNRPAATFEQLAKLAGCDVLLFGHTHLPYRRRVGRTLFVNAGSVGRPKDGDPRAGYAVLQLERHRKVEFRRVAYDVHAAARAVREAGLPPRLADLLETGGAPAASAALTAIQPAPA